MATHARTSINLHHRNLQAAGPGQETARVGCPALLQQPDPVYAAKGYVRRPRRGNQPRPGRVEADQQLAHKEVRSYEVDQVGALWHLDFHTSRQIAVLRADGSWIRPRLLAVMDDRSRLCDHAQFYLDETDETLCHGFHHALLKFGLPRQLMSDNGSR